MCVCKSICHKVCKCLNSSQLYIELKRLLLNVLQPWQIVFTMVSFARLQQGTRW